MKWLISCLANDVYKGMSYNLKHLLIFKEIYISLSQQTKSTMTIIVFTVLLKTN